MRHGYGLRNVLMLPDFSVQSGCPMALRFANRSKIAVATAVASIMTLTGAEAADGTVSVNLARARTSFGIMNTDLVQFGTIFVRSRNSSTMTQLDTVTIPDDALQKPVTAGAVTLTDIKGLDVNVSLTSWVFGDVAAIAAEAKRNANIYIKEVSTERLKAPLRVLNSEAMKDSRKFYATSYQGDFIFEFIFDVTRVDEGGLGFGKPFKIGAKLSFPQQVGIKGLNFDVNYANSSVAAFQGKGTPMFYKSQSFRLVPNGDDFRFVPFTPQPSKRS
jgi:hypothetical protein